MESMRGEKRERARERGEKRGKEGERERGERREREGKRERRGRERVGSGIDGPSEPVLPARV
jgi:hypothetical protein